MCLVGYAQTILRHSEYLLYSKYFHVRPFLERIASQVAAQDRLSNEILKLLFIYDKKLEQKRTKEKVKAIKEEERFTRTISEVRMYVVCGNMPD